MYDIEGDDEGSGTHRCKRTGGHLATWPAKEVRLAEDNATSREATRLRKKCELYLNGDSARCPHFRRALHRRHTKVNRQSGKLALGGDEAVANSDEVLTMSAGSQRLTLQIEGHGEVSALLCDPAGARACFVFGHGAGAGMEHPSMSSVARDLADRGIATLRYQFPYMERRSRRPDPPPVCHATVRAAVAAAARSLPAVPLFAGGRSFGGRMTSQAQAAAPLPGVRGLVFFAFPLHPAGKPADSRAAHLAGVAAPMLFLQGTRDALAELHLLRPVVASLGPLASLVLSDGADHAFHVPARSGRKDADVLAEMLDAAAAWMAGHA